jgi:carbonic anhydrase
LPSAAAAELRPTPRPSTPAAALAELLSGNQRFVADARWHPNQDAAHRAALASGQTPYAVVFGCSDSRLAAEIIFDQGLGDLFVVRTAGHTVGPEVMGSIEYAVTVLGTPLVVVLGHSSCGAVAATCAAISSGAFPESYLRRLVEAIEPSVQLAAQRGRTDVDSIVDVHIERTVGDLPAFSPVLAAKVASGQCAIVGMSYQLSAGDVHLVAADGPVDQVDGQQPRLR